MLRLGSHAFKSCPVEVFTASGQERIRHSLIDGCRVDPDPGGHIQQIFTLVTPKGPDSRSGSRKQGALARFGFDPRMVFTEAGEHATSTELPATGDRKVMSEQIEALKLRYPGAETFKFGDNAILCERLLSLVRSGRKVATCSALRDLGHGEPMPAIGRRDIALNWDDTPALVIETVELIECRFDEVTEAMALAEGEDDSLEAWRTGHAEYFERNGGFSPDMEIVWERFVLVEDLN